jgi:hypothetical protein
MSDGTWILSGDDASVEVVGALVIVAARGQQVMLSLAEAAALGTALRAAGVKPRAALRQPEAAPVVEVETPWWVVAGAESAQERASGPAPTQESRDAGAVRSLADIVAGGAP